VKILVTGGAGFIGSHIVDNLIRENCEVTVVDDLSSGLTANLNPAADFLRLDIARDDLGPVFAAGFDYVIHQAAQTMVPRSLLQPDHDCRVNVLGTVNLLEACRHSGVKRVVFASSAAVYGDVATIPVSEDAPTRPTSFYGLSKLVGERYLELYAQLYGLQYVVLRYANVYGERQGDAGEGGVISIFTRSVHAGRPLIIFGDGGQTRDFIYVGDVAAANCQALFTPRANRVYNISSGTETSVNQLVDQLAAVSGRPVAKEYQPPREGDIYRSTLANAAALGHLGWRPRMSLGEGLAATYRSLVGC
jgi:UDP-glucose 4-epimerase